MASTPLASGTSFPVSPSDGDWFLRTDRNVTYYYNLSLTRWLSTDLKYTTFMGPVVLNGGTTAGNGVGFLPIFDDIYIENWATTAYVGTTNDGSNYYSISLLKATPTVSSTVTSFDTSADTVAHRTLHTVSVNTLFLAATYAWIETELSTKVGAPGAAYVTSMITFRAAG